MVKEAVRFLSFSIFIVENADPFKFKTLPGIGHHTTGQMGCMDDAVAA